MKPAPVYAWALMDGHCIFGGERVFTGDALLIDGCGRTDFQNGNAQDLFYSARNYSRCQMTYWFIRGMIIMSDASNIGQRKPVIRVWAATNPWQNLSKLWAI